jgi:hypothetical protein
MAILLRHIAAGPQTTPGGDHHGSNARSHFSSRSGTA